MLPRFRRLFSVLVSKTSFAAVPAIGFFMLFLVQCAGDETASPRVHRGDLISKSNLNFDYVEGDVVNCKNVSIVYLKGDVRGEKGRGLHIQVMKGNVQSGEAKIDVLDGDILEGRSVSVRLLLGEDLSGRADVLERSTTKRSAF